MCYRRSFSFVGLALLCILSSSVTAKAGSLSYEGLEGARCQVTTDTPSELNFESGYSENMGANVRFGVSIPLSNPTAAARRNCVEFAQQDQRRQHFTWLLDMYERGVITREALQTEAEALGMSLAPERSLESADDSAVIIR